MIKAGKVVKISYVLKDGEGNEIETVSEAEPFEYLHGGGEVVAGLEGALEGKMPGDQIEAKVPPATGYGAVIPDLKLKLERSQFPEGTTIEVGTEFSAPIGDKQNVIFRVDGVNGDEISVNGNHPLAGKNLEFRIKILSVRDATEVEIRSGLKKT